MAKLTPLNSGSITGRIGQQVGVKPYRTTSQSQILQTTKQSVSTTQPSVNYDAAWETAKSHWLKGRAGDYLYYMQKEAGTDPQIAAVYNYVKALDKQTRSGNISPGRSRGSLLGTTSEQAKTEHNIRFFGGKQSSLDSGVVNQSFINNMPEPTITTMRTPATFAIQPYGGITLPYGQKDITWRENLFGSISSEHPKGYREVSLIDEMKRKEQENPDLFKPSKILWGQESEKISKKVINEETSAARKTLDDNLIKIQAKIDSGEMSLERGKVVLKKIQDNLNKKLEKDVNKRYEKELSARLGSEEFKQKVDKSERARKEFEVAFSPEYKAKRTLGRIELGADVLAMGAGAIIPPVGLAYFAGKSFYKASKGADKDIRMATYSPSGELQLPRYAGLIPSKESKEAGMNLLFAGGYGLGQVSKIGHSITRLRESELAASTWKVKSQTLFTKGDTTMLKLTGSKSTGLGSAEGSALFPVKIEKNGAFKILAGEGKVSTRVVDFMKQGTVSPSKAIIRSEIDFGLGGRGVVSKGYYRGKDFIIPTKNMWVTSGEGYVAPRTFSDVVVSFTWKKSKFWSAFTKDSGREIGKPMLNIKGTHYGSKSNQFLFGGLTRKEGKRTLFTSGKLLKVRLYKKSKVFTGKFKPEVFGDDVLKQAKKPTIGFKGGGAKSSKEFIKSLSRKTPSQQIKNLYEKPTQQQIQKISKPTRVSSKSKPSSKIIGKQFSGTSFARAEKLLKVTQQAARPRFALLTATKELSAYAVITQTKNAMGLKTKVAQESLVRQMDKLNIKTMQRTKTLQKLTTKQRSKIGQRTSQIQIAPQIVSFVSPSIRGKGGFGFGVEIPIPAPKLPGSVTQKKHIKTSQTYIPQAKAQGGKWITLSKEPMSRSGALSRGARATDQTLSAQFRIKKTTDSKPGKSGSYFSATKRKYRPYKIKKGTPIKLQNQFIEKRGNRIDTRGEKKGLKLAAYVKKRGWDKKKVKKKKGSKK